MTRKRGREKGFFALESLILLACLLIATTGVLAAYRAILLSARATTQTEAAFLAQDEIESYLANKQLEGSALEAERDGVVYHIERDVEEQEDRKEVVARIRWSVLGREEQLELRREVVEHGTKK